MLPVRQLASVIGALLLAVVIPPSARAGDQARERLEGTNPTLVQKLIAYDQWVRANAGPPDVLVLGSSRSVAMDPVLIRRVSGARAFNAGISSSGARELRAFSSYADIRSPGEFPHLVMFLDLEALDSRRPTARVVLTYWRILALRTVCIPVDCRQAGQRLASTLAREAVAHERAYRAAGGRPSHESQRADGFQINGTIEALDRTGADMDALRDRRIVTRIGSYRSAFDRLYPAPKTAFEQAVALANRRGDTPVIVLTAMHTECIQRCGAAGWNARHQEVRAHLDELQVRLDFRVIDLSIPSSWGGSGASFFDEVHLRPAGAALVVRRLQRFGAFEPR